MASNSWKDLSDQLTDTVEKLGPAVVRVEGRRRGASSGVVWSRDTIVTASHTVQWEEEIRVGRGEGDSAAARLIGRDPSTDVAALKVEGMALPVPDWSDADVKVGQLVLGLLRPGRAIRASLGVIAARAETWRGPAGGRFDQYLESDLALRRGFSGSALADSDGRIVGMNTSGVLRGAPFVVSTSTLRRVIVSLAAHGHVRRGYLGIGAYPVLLPAPLAAKAGQPAGLLLLSVAPESPASEAGLLLGDVLVSLGGEAVENPQDLVPLLDEDRIGKSTVARILRGGEARELPITVAARAGDAA